MSDSPPQPDDLLKGLRKTFVGRLPERLRSIEGLWASALGGNREDRETLHREVHRLSGSGTTFGFPDLSAAARRLEALLDGLIGGGDLDRPALDTALGRLSQSVDEAVAEGREESSSAYDAIRRELETAPSVEATSVGLILLVEDDDLLGQVLRRQIEAVGYSCVLAPDGEQALAIAGSLRPDLILLDVVLPGLDGFETCRRLRRLDALVDVPIIFLTSIADESKILEAYELGADDYMTKPFNSAVLLAKMRAVVNRRTMDRLISTRDLEVGHLIDERYRLIRKLGRGGMGVVYQVRDAKQQVDRALKALLTEDAGDAEDEERARERFRREVKTLGGLSHPNLIRVHDAGSHGRILYYVMDYLAGGTLYARLQTTGPYPVRRSLAEVAKIAGALQCAHDQGVLHRDLKSDNVLYSADEEPILTDFSLVLSVQKRESRLTRTGMVFGTPQYMSPEQLRDDPGIDGRSDVYALGIVLFEMLTGTTPLAGLSDAETFARVLVGDLPAPSDVADDIDPGAEAVCLRAMALQPDDRFATAADMAAEAERRLDS